MKTKEFIEKVEELDFVKNVEEDDYVIRILGQSIYVILATVGTEENLYLDTSFIGFEGLEVEEKCQLFDLLVEYARTPVEEREEEECEKMKLEEICTNLYNLWHEMDVLMYILSEKYGDSVYFDKYVNYVDRLHDIMIEVKKYAKLEETKKAARR